MAYNPWYTDTYEPILTLARWDDFKSDVAKKIVAIFSWMPQTIMSIKHSKDEMKFQVYSLENMKEAIANCEKSFNAVSRLQLQDAVLEENKDKIVDIVNNISPLIGTVAVSKYLHFSAPHFFPMWDRQIRILGNYKDNAEGYYQYMRKFQEDLQIKRNLCAALERYPNNPIRGWDVICMENR